MVTVAPGISAPDGSAMCPRRLAAAVESLVTEEGVTAVVEVCPFAAATPDMPNARAIKKRVKQCNLEYTNPPNISCEKEQTPTEKLIPQPQSQSSGSSWRAGSGWPREPRAAARHPPA